MFTAVTEPVVNLKMLQQLYSCDMQHMATNVHFTKFDWNNADALQRDNYGHFQRGDESKSDRQ